MAGITKAQAQAQLDAWIAASLAVAQGQEYTIGDRHLKRADAAEIRQQIAFWESKLQRLARGGGAKVRFGIPQ
jgi:hypothetical protein